MTSIARYESNGDSEVMRKDRPSTTAAIVAAARAEIHRNPTIRDFSDPFAEKLLPRSYSRGPMAKAIRRLTRWGCHLFALRTNAIDHGIRTAERLEQLVILGAGLDARAWRLPEVSDIPVFEVDHPSTQRYKRRKAEQFEQRDQHHYVAVDFEKDSLDERLADAGHDPQKGTVWIWEGVTMYLHPEAVESTLSVVQKRSTEKSRALITYLPPSSARSLVNVGVRVLGEPLRANYRPAQMQSLLDRFGFDVVCDETYADWHERWAFDRKYLSRAFGDTERMVAADRRGGE